MKDALAEKLLVKVLNWDAQQIARELPRLQAMAVYKYDEYQQFSPGMRFVESLARWLGQFAPDERDTAFRFVMDELIFCSSSEMAHFVEVAYPHHVRPLLLAKVAAEAGVNRRHVARVAETAAFKVRQRQCLFLGLSDGARIDSFRRSNPDLNHEQIWQTHELSDDRVGELLEKLTADVLVLSGKDELSSAPLFKTVVLLDDFSASGSSYYMPGKPNSGKIAKFRRKLFDHASPLSRLVDVNDLEVIILLYVATEQARNHLVTESAERWGNDGVHVSVEVVQPLSDEIRHTADSATSLTPLIDKYYDDAIHDEHMKKGGSPDSRYGFAACGLPVVLHHNSPNNSIALLWSYEDTTVRGLFPRIKRHKETL